MPLPVMSETFTFEELEAIASLIQFHDDWDDLSDILDIDVHKLFDKVCDLQTELNELEHTCGY